MPLALACLACTSLNKQHAKTVTETSQRLQQKEQQLITTKTAKVWVDTSSAAVEVAFWPKGMVKYSPITGFEGEATQIKVKVKQQRSSLLSESKDQNLIVNKEFLFKQDENSKVKTAFKSKTQPYFWMMSCFTNVRHLCRCSLFIVQAQTGLG